MKSVVADTHAVLWYLLGSSRLSMPARACMLSAFTTVSATTCAAFLTASRRSWP
jgi:PIN domain nuclease of toxin-antitoxin system